MFRPYKFLIVPVIQEVDENGNVVRELQIEQPVFVFGVEGLHRFADEFTIDGVEEMNGRRDHAGHGVG